MELCSSSVESCNTHRDTYTVQLKYAKHQNRTLRDVFYETNTYCFEEENFQQTDFFTYTLVTVKTNVPGFRSDACAANLSKRLSSKQVELINTTSASAQLMTVASPCIKDILTNFLRSKDSCSVIIAFHLANRCIFTQRKKKGS